jgi:hypothetical protein
MEIPDARYRLRFEKPQEFHDTGVRLRGDLLTEVNQQGLIARFLEARHRYRKLYKLMWCRLPHCPAIGVQLLAWWSVQDPRLSADGPQLYWMKSTYAMEGEL